VTITIPKLRDMTRRAKAALAIALAVVLTIAVAACTSTPDSRPQDNAQANKNFQAQEKNVPVPPLTDSLERRNIAEHLKRNNQPDRVRYIYLLADTGGIYAYFVIKGKVTSAASQLTPTDDIYTHSYGNLDLQASGDDGSFGGDEGGIYFFTDTGQEIQWNGRWLLSDNPLTIKQPSLTLETK
jgi:hypothetical protein